MTEKRNFETLFLEFRSSIPVRLAKEISTHFRPDQYDLIHMVDKMWSMKEFHQHMSFKMVIPMKDTLKAEQAKSVGNDLYASQKLLRALTVYNTSIRHVNPKDDALKTLAIAYGNRSCVLYELGLYDRCLEDIKRALDNNFPESVRNKLYRRRVKCHLSNKAFKQAEACWKDYENQKLKDHVKVETFKEFFDAFLRGPKGRPDPNFVSIVARQRDLEAPLPKTVHPKITSMSDAISINYTKEKGRHLIAERDIKPGEVLITEPAFATVLLQSQMSSHCGFCQKRTMNPIPCESCTLSVFCDEDCRSSANRLFHSVECGILATLLYLDMGVNAALVIRIIALLLLSPDYRLPQAMGEGYPGSDPRMAGFDTNGVYDSTKYRPIHNLVDNCQTRTVGDMFKRTAMALVLFKLLLTTPAAIESMDRVDTSEAIPRKFVAAAELLLKLNMTMPCNAHTLTEFYEDKLDYSKSQSDDIGAGAFAVLSLINHSCNPNINRTCYGTTVVARSITSIPKGLEITDCYGMHYAMTPLKGRRENLMRQYHFTCTCYPCTVDWETYEKMPSRVRARCPYCGVAIEDLDATVCPKCNREYGEATFAPYFPYPVNRRRINEELNDMMEQYQNSFENVMQGNSTSQDEKIIGETIELLARFSALPNRPYFEAQEAFKNIQIADGLRYVKFQATN